MNTKGVLHLLDSTEGNQNALLVSRLDGSE